MWLRLLNLVGLDGLNCVRVFDSNIAEMKAYDCNVLAPRKRFWERVPHEQDHINSCYICDSSRVS